MKIRHTVIFAFYESTSEDQKKDVITRLNDTGCWLTESLGVINWTVAKHTPDTFRKGRAET